LDAVAAATEAGEADEVAVCLEELRDVNVPHELHHDYQPQE
jgi:hypothetical protein